MTKQEVIPRPDVVPVEFLLLDGQLPGERRRVLPGNGKDVGFAGKEPDETLLLMRDVVCELHSRVRLFEIPL